MVRNSCFACLSNQIEADLGVVRTQVCIFAPPTRLTRSSSNNMHLPRAAKLQALRHWAKIVVFEFSSHVAYGTKISYFFRYN